MEFKNIALFARRGKVPVPAMNKLIDFFLKKGCEVLLEKEAADTLGRPGGLSFGELAEQADVAVIYGGDGTMLGICRKLAPFSVPVIGVNAGHLGFITDIGSETMETELEAILGGHYYVDNRRLLQARQYRDGKLIFSGIALNEVCLSRGISGGMVEFNVKVNNLPVCLQRADGLMFSTPTGSTAYALSVGGPLISPSVPCILMISVAPHTLNNRPIILNEQSRITVDIMDIRDAALYFDMQDYNELRIGDKVEISSYQHDLHILHPYSHSFFDTINQKLHWNEMPSTRTMPTC